VIFDDENGEVVIIDLDGSYIQVGKRKWAQIKVS
jgi:hypothetical protein